MGVPLHNDTDVFAAYPCLDGLVGGRPTSPLSSIFVPNMYAICWE